MLCGESLDWKPPSRWNSDAGTSLKHTYRQCLMWRQSQNTRIRKGLYAIKNTIVNFFFFFFLTVWASPFPNSHHHHLPQNSCKLSMGSLWPLKGRKECHWSSEARALRPPGAPRGRTWASAWLSLPRGSPVCACAGDAAVGRSEEARGAHEGRESVQNRWENGENSTLPFPWRAIYVIALFLRSPQFGFILLSCVGFSS